MENAIIVKIQHQIVKNVDLLKMLIIMKNQCVLYANLGYFLNSEGECIYYLNYLQKIPNCETYSYTINNITFCTYSRYYEERDYYSDNNYFYSPFYCYVKNYYYDYFYNYKYYYSLSLEEYKKNYNNNILIPKINSIFEGQCIRCQEGFYFDSDGNCKNK